MNFYMIILFMLILEVLYLISLCILYRLYITRITHQKPWGCKVQEKLHLRVGERKMLNTIALVHCSLLARDHMGADYVIKILNYRKLQCHLPCITLLTNIVFEKQKHMYRELQCSNTVRMLNVNETFRDSRAG
jgi:hypothetical protein